MAVDALRDISYVGAPGAGADGGEEVATEPDAEGTPALAGLPLPEPARGVDACVALRAEPFDVPAFAPAVVAVWRTLGADGAAGALGRLGGDTAGGDGVDGCGAAGGDAAGGCT